MKTTGLLIILLLFAGGLAAGIHDPEDVSATLTFKVSKEGQLAFNRDVGFGEKVLRKGRFVMEHRVENNQHWIRFTPIAAKGLGPDSSKAVEVQAKTGRADEKVTRTEILAYPGRDHFEIVRITIAGENVEHLF